MQKIGVLVLVLLAAISSMVYIANSSITGEAKSGSVIFTNKGGSYSAGQSVSSSQPAPPYSIARSAIMVEPKVYGDGGDFCFNAYSRAGENFAQRTYCYYYVEKAQQVARQMRPSVAHVSEIFTR